MTKLREFCCPINGRVRIILETDAENPYFDSLVGHCKSIEFNRPSIVSDERLYNGRYALILTPSNSEDELTVGEKIEFTIKITNKKPKKEFEIKFLLEITDELFFHDLDVNWVYDPNKPGPLPPGEPSEPWAREKVPNDRDTDEGEISLPKLEAISKITDPDKWNEHFANEYQGAKFIHYKGKWVAKINVSNPNLEGFIKLELSKANPKNKTKIVNEYKMLVGYVPFAMHMLKEGKKVDYKLTDEKGIPIEDIMGYASDAIALMGMDVTNSFKDLRRGKK